MLLPTASANSKLLLFNSLFLLLYKLTKPLGNSILVVSSLRIAVISLIMVSWLLATELNHPLTTGLSRTLGERNGENKDILELRGADRTCAVFSINLLILLKIE